MDTLVNDPLWNAVAPWLPVHPPSPQGGRRRVPDRLCLNGIVFVLREGLRWQSLPIALGWGSGSTCWRRFDEWTAAGVWEAAHVALVTALGEQGLLNLERAVIDSSSQRAVRGGAHTGPNPTDRAKKGCKRHLITDGQGLPLVAQTGPANRRDEQALPGLLWWLWAVLSYGCAAVPRCCRGIGATASPGRSRWSWPGASGRCWRCAAARMAAAWGGHAMSWSGRIAGSTITGAWSCATSSRERTTRASTSWPPASSVPIACGTDGRPARIGNRLPRPLRF